MKKFFSILLVIFILLPGSAFHDMLLILLLAWMWRKQWVGRVRSIWKYGYATVLTLLLFLTFMLMPRPFALPSDRVRLVYFDDKGKQTSAPLAQWAWNLILPEETMCALGSCIPFTPLRSMLPIGESILKNFDEDLSRGKMHKFGTAYRKLNLSLESPLSGVGPQGFHQLLGTKSRAAYIIRPKNFDEDREYPVLFFAHGYLGNWKLYTGPLKDIQDHIIVCIGTEDFSGIFSPHHIREIDSLYLPLLEDLGYKVDRSAISLMGLSNGGSAVDAAYAMNPNRFKNLIYVSTGVNHTSRTRAKVMIIGGGKDHCAPSMNAAMRRLKANGQPSAFHFDEADTHFKLVTDLDGCTTFLNQNL